MSICNTCGKEIDDGYDYCEECVQQEFINNKSMNEDKMDLDKKKNNSNNFTDDEIIDKKMNQEMNDILSLDDLEMDDDLQEGIDKFLALEEDNIENSTTTLEDGHNLVSDLDLLNLLSDEDLQMINSESNNIDNNAEKDDFLSAIMDNQDEEDFLASIMGSDKKEDTLSSNIVANNEEDDFLASILNQNITGDSMNREKESPNSMGDIFADVLSAVSELEDMDDEEDLFQYSDENLGKFDNDKKSTLQNKEDRRERKKLAFAKIFENVHDEKSKENARKEQELEEIQKRKAEEKKAKRAAKKEAKKNEAEAKKAAKAQKLKIKEEAKAKKKALRAQKEAKEREFEVEEPEDEGRINLVGATFILSTFAVLAIVIIVGTNIYSYTQSIKVAARKFENEKYNDAYEEVYGLDIKDDDIELYDKIVTVMYVEKQLNSYNNYMALEKYPEALDSLLKGLKRYEKYIELATELGIETDLKHVRKQIVTELNRKFELNEKNAMKIIKMKDQTEYSITVYEIVMDNMEKLVAN